MYSTCKIKNISGAIRALNEHEFQIDEIFTITDDKRVFWSSDDNVLTDITNGNMEIHNDTGPVEGINNQINYLKSSLPSQIDSVGELILTWVQMKAFYSYNSASYINYIEFSTHYYIWLCYRNQKMYVPMLYKGTQECTDFETNYKSKCNIPEHPRTRITTCKEGRYLHSRGFTFKTAYPNSLESKDYLGNSYNDFTYTMKDANQETTNNYLLCKETWVTFEPTYNFEIIGGEFMIPSTLVGDDDDWNLYVIGVPDIPKEFGGTIDFISNCKLKWYKGQQILCDCSINPAELKYDVNYHTNKLLFIIKHTTSVQQEFHIQLLLFK